MKTRSLARRRFAALVLASASTILLVGCGGGSHSPRLSSVPLVHGAQVVANVRNCDQGANPYCTLELVVVDSSYPSSSSFVQAERNLLRSHGWSGASPPAADELADTSPGNGLRITYAPAYVDLKGIDLGWIQRAPTVQRSLSRQLFAGNPAMSALLQVGSQ
jgi:hypothetical protein